MSQISIYRIVKKKWRDSAFDGEGARLYGGRWNSKGKPCVYVAGSESLAILEILVHLQADSLLNSYSLIKSTIPTSKVMSIGKLPDNWRSEPAPSQTAEIGDLWLKSKQSLALRVPSVIVPREFNYLINPNDPDMQEVLNNVEEIDIEIDSRLL